MKDFERFRLFQKKNYFNDFNHSFSLFLKLERKVLILDERVKQLENENEQLRMKMGANDRTVRSIKSNKSNLNLDLMNIKLVTSSMDKNEIIVKDGIICDEEDEDESMQTLQNNNLVVLTTDDRIEDDEDDLDDD